LGRKKPSSVFLKAWLPAPLYNGWNLTVSNGGQNDTSFDSDLFFLANFSRFFLKKPKDKYLPAKLPVFLLQGRWLFHVNLEY